MEGNRTPPRNGVWRAPERNFTNRAPLRRARGLRNLNVLQNNGEAAAPVPQLSFFERIQQAQGAVSNFVGLNNNNSVNNISVEEFNVNNIATQRAPFPNIMGNEEEHNQSLQQPDFSRSAIMSIKQPVTVKVGSSLKVYDYGEVDEVDVNPFALDDAMLVFKSANSYFQYPKEIFVEHLRNNENIVFECNRKLLSAPYKRDIHFDAPYYLLRASGNFIVPYGDMLQATEMSYGAYELRKTDKHLEYTTSYDSVIIEYPYGFRGQQIDIMSADHCQAGSDRDVYELVPIRFVDGGAGGTSSGGRRRRGGGQKGRGLTFSKTQRKKKILRSANQKPMALRVHTLTGTRKNIERQKKSVNKLHKIFGVNKN